MINGAAVATTSSGYGKAGSANIINDCGNIWVSAKGSAFVGKTTALT